ncbi:hypothetical protein Q5762_17395 [Streptomyces sp. P9(2023)]|uniref:hypothetical protein n=1 Tax=Streptomyces sp. P9(2023) TaxID=3064394 RepID=UPI0028F4568F|nr:hypothetical protein [Streptomyces sp. P9(2023)]MDT9690079.1 hypothetical protein [Streptomyces sp. P9(2023)]
MARSRYEADQIVFRWDSENAVGTTGFGPVAWSGPRDEVETLFHIYGALLRASGEETRPALLRVEQRAGVVLIRRMPGQDPGGRTSVVCHALVGSPELLDPAFCLGLHGWDWEGAELPSGRVRGSLPVVPRDALVASSVAGQRALDLAGPRVERELTGAVAELLRHPQARFTLLDERGDTAYAVLRGLHAMFGDVPRPRRWTFASHDTAELTKLRYVFVGQWAGAASRNTDRRRVDPRERVGDMAEELAARLVHHHLGGPEGAVVAALREAPGAADLSLLETAERAVTRLDKPSRARSPYDRPNSPEPARGTPWVADDAAYPPPPALTPDTRDTRDAYGETPAASSPYDDTPSAPPHPRDDRSRGVSGSYGEAPGAEVAREDSGLSGAYRDEPAGPSPYRESPSGPSPYREAPGGPPPVREDPGQEASGLYRDFPGPPPAPAGNPALPPMHQSAPPAPSTPSAPPAPSAPPPQPMRQATAAPAPHQATGPAAPQRPPEPPESYPRPAPAPAEGLLPVVAPVWREPKGGRTWWRRGRSRRGRPVETGLVRWLSAAPDDAEARIRAAGDAELLTALRGHRPYQVTTLLMHELARRVPTWPHPMRREFRDLVLAHELFVTAPRSALLGEPDDTERAANAAALYRWAVRPLLDEGDAPAPGVLVVLLTRLRASPVPAARSAFAQIVDDERPGLPEAVWRGLVQEPRPTEPPRTHQTQPPVHQPPVHQPPLHQPPLHQPPLHQPPVHQPPVPPPPAPPPAPPDAATAPPRAPGDGRLVALTLLAALVTLVVVIVAVSVT